MHSFTALHYAVSTFTHGLAYYSLFAYTDTGSHVCMDQLKLKMGQLIHINTFLIKLYYMLAKNIATMSLRTSVFLFFP